MGEEGHLIIDGILPENACRNRFHNIIPCEHRNNYTKPIIILYDCVNYVCNNKYVCTPFVCKEIVVWIESGGYEPPKDPHTLLKGDS